jgi:hypothetical protein
MSYEYWERALADPKALQRREFKITDQPQPGFYRTKTGQGVAIWQDYDFADGVLVMAIDGEDVPLNNFERVWLSCAIRPVSEAWFRSYEDTGRWPDVDAGLAGMGDNVSKGMDEVEQIELLNAEVAKYREILDDDTAAQAQSLRARLMELRGKVDKKREELKQPHLKAAREVDEIYMAPVKKANAAANVLKGLVEMWETVKRRRAREEAAAVERARMEAEQANQPLAPLNQPAPEPVPEPKQQIRAGYGRAASVRERLVVVGISDFTAALREFGHSDEVAELMIRLAQGVVDRGGRVPHGFATELRAVIR